MTTPAEHRANGMVNSIFGLLVAATVAMLLMAAYLGSTGQWRYVFPFSSLGDA